MAGPDFTRTQTGDTGTAKASLLAREDRFDSAILIYFISSHRYGCGSLAIALLL